MAESDFHFDVDISLENVEKEFGKILEVIKPTWNKSSLTFQTTGQGAGKGVANKMVHCFSDSSKDGIMIRITNSGMNFFVSRKAEIIWIKHFMPLGCAPKILATFKNGFCYEFIEGEVVGIKRLGEEPFWRMIAERIALFNAAKIDHPDDIAKTPKINTFFEEFWKRYPTHFDDPKKNEIFKREFPNRSELEAEIEMIQEHCEQLNSPNVTAHNDTRGENIIWNEKTGQMTFIDFELAGYNYQASELAWHFIRYCGFNPPDFSLYPSEEFQLSWLRHYLEKYNEFQGNKMEVTNKDVQRLYVQVSKHYLLYLLAGTVMAMAYETLDILEEGLIDCMQLAIVTIKQYYKLKEKILAMKMP